MDKLKRLIGHTVAAMMIPITYSAEQDVENNEDDDVKRVLMVTATEIFRHASINDAHKVMPQLADEHRFEVVDITEGLDLLTADNLGNYDVLAFVNTNGRLQEFVRVFLSLANKQFKEVIYGVQIEESVFIIS